jgi:hypothetical protein
MEYHDDFHNTANITKCKCRAYYGAKMQNAFILDLFDDKGFHYYRSVFETREEAIKTLSGFSCGTFK